MKRRQIFTLLFLTILTILAISISCEKEPDPPAGTGSFLPGSVPATTVQAAQNLTYTGAEVNVQLTSTGNRVIKRLCLCYSTTKTEPDTTDQTVELGQVTATGTYKATLQSLNHNTKYYYRAYCRNLVGSSYSTGLDFTTPKDIRLPEVTTGNATSVTESGATLAGTITSFGQGSTSVTQHGHVWATHDNPTLSDQKTQLGSTTSTSITSIVTGLTVSTVYYFSAYATNGTGTTYGTIKSFTTFNLPTVTSAQVTNVNGTSASSGGTVTTDGGSSVTARGVCWSISQNPTINDSKTVNGSGTGTFTSSITGLTHSTTYHLRAYATNQFGTSYGEQRTFTTATLYPPTVSTAEITNVTATTANCGGTVSDDGGSTVTARGVCWSTSQNPTISDSKTLNGTGTGSFTSSITGLTNGTTYYVRAYATNAIGTNYGEQRTLTTTTLYPPSVTTAEVTGITYNSAACGGNVVADGGSSVTARGVCWSTSQNPTINNSNTVNGSGTGSFTSSITGLSQSTTYYVRAYATNAVGTNYGEQRTFTTLTLYPPMVNTAEVTGITYQNATCGGTVTSDGNSPVTARGVCWSTGPNPTVANSTTSNGSGTGNFTSSISGLTHSTTYYVRAYATSAYGTAYGEQRTFTTVSLYPATVTTAEVTSITYNSAVCGGTVTADGGAPVTARGVCWSTSQNPTISDNKTVNGSGTGSYTSSVTGLIHGTTYYIRAYATTAYGTSYGNERSFITVTLYPPTVTTSSVTSVTSSSAVCGGTVTSDGGSSVTARGVCWSTSQNPTISDNKTINGSGIGSFLSNVTGLTAGTIYYIRAYATNTAGTAYGEEREFVTEVALPILTTTNITEITAASAVSGGDISSDGGSAVSSRGVVWGTSQNPTTTENIGITSNGTGLGSYSSLMINLTPSTTYYVRAYATNSVGISYGNQRSFTTLNGVITMATAEITNVTATTASCGGNITSDGGSSITVRGVVWSTSQNPTIDNNEGITINGSGTGVYSSSITELSSNTTYYVRAYATNGFGTEYGNQVGFTTLIPDGLGDILTDIEGNEYNTVWIGGRLWMKENLKTSKLNDGTSISFVTNNTTWINQTNPAYCWYGNQSSLGEVYGGLYNWYSVNTNKLCPLNWHVPSLEEWSYLASYVGGAEMAGIKLKAKNGWDNNGNGTDDYNFSAIPGGGRGGSYGNFFGLYTSGNWWTNNSVAGFEEAYYIGMFSNYQYLSIGNATFKMVGFSVRCVKDE